MRVIEEQVEGYVYCQNLLPAAGRSRRRCEGYEPPQPALIIRSTSTWYFGDFSGGSGTDVDEMMADMPSTSVERVRLANPDDRLCPHCGELTREAMVEAEHPIYPHVSDQDPDRLLELDDAQRKQAAAAADQAASLQDLVLELRASRVQDRELIQQLLAERHDGNGNGAAIEEPALEEPAVEEPAPARPPRKR